MPAKSEKQRKFMAVVRAYKRGKKKNVGKAVRDAAKSMSDKEVTDFMKKEAAKPGHMLAAALNRVGTHRLDASQLSDAVRKFLNVSRDSMPTGNTITSKLTQRYRGYGGGRDNRTKAIFAPAAKRKQAISDYYRGHEKAISDDMFGVQAERDTLADLLKTLRSNYGHLTKKSSANVTTLLDTIRDARLEKEAQMPQFRREDLYDYGIPAAAVGGGLVAGKGAYDIHRLAKTVGRAGKDMDVVREALMAEGRFNPVMDPVLGYKVPLGLDAADAAVNAYNRAARDVAHSKILGVRAGSLYKGLVGAQTAAGLLQDRRGVADKLKGAAMLPRDLRAAADDFSQYLHHMKMFTDPKIGVNNLRGHLLSQVMSDDLRVKFLPETPGLRKSIIEAANAGKLEDILHNIKMDPESYGFLGKGHASRFGDDLLNIMRNEGKPVEDILNYFGGRRAIPDAAVSYLTGGSPDSLARRLEYMRTNANALGLNDPDYIDALDRKIRKRILGGEKWKTLDKDVGAALDMVGNQKKVVGRARAYFENIARAGKQGRTALAALGIPAVAYGLSSIYKGLKGDDRFNKTAQAVDDRYEGLKEKVRDALPFLAAAPAGLYGASKIAPSRDIAVTYGTMQREFGGPNITGGHKNPAVAIKEILRDKEIAPWYAKYFNVADDIVRGEGGILNRPTVNPNVLIDTGFGALFKPDEAQSWVPRYIGQYEKLNPLSVMSYQTDLAPSALRHAGATTAIPEGVFKGRRDVMGYGPNIREYFSEMKRTMPKATKNVKMRYLGDSLGPAIMQGSMENAKRELNRVDVLKDLADYYDKQNMPELAQQFRNVADEKLVVISGSTRGDYVAQRAAALSDALKRKGVTDVKILAQLSDAIDDPITQSFLEKHPEVIRAPRMPNQLYTGIQSVADLHAGSSGASAAAESAMLRSPVSVPADWGAWGGIKPKPGTPAAEVYEKAVKFGLDELMNTYGIDPASVDVGIRNAMSKNLGEDLNSYMGKITSGNFERLSPEDIKGLEQLRAAVAPEHREAFAGKLNRLIESGDLEGIPDRLAPTADWNEGILQYLRKMKGSVDWDPDKIADLLNDPAALKALKAEAAQRGQDELQKILASRKALSQSVYSRALKNYMGTSAKGAAGLLAALGLTGYGVKKILDKVRDNRSPQL